MASKSLLITGGTGFLGHALVKQWLERGYSVTMLSRQPQAAMTLFGNAIQAVSALEALPSDSRFDAVINLAGEPIFAGRWTAVRKQRMRDSRIKLTEALVAFIGRLQVKPEVLVSGSAIGVYGNQGDTLLTEDSPGIADFGQQLCADWEQAALQAEHFGVRVCLIRTGLVLGQDGGMLQRMLPAFRLGLGGRLGDGKQWMSWIHRNDWLAIVDTLLENSSLRGAFNATAPNALTNAEFTRILASQLRRPALMPMPATILKLSLGEMAELVLGSQRVVPERLLAADFDFRFPHLDTALQQILPQA